MRESKPLHLHVSLVPAELSSMEPQGGTRPSANSGVSDSPQRTPRATVKAYASEKGAEARVGTKENGRVTEDEGSVVEDPASMRHGAPAPQQVDAPTGDDAQWTPWVLDICLDYFTTENPFLAELEDCIGKEDAGTVRDFYEKPTFRGAGTPLPHATQLEHERIFKAEVDRLLRSIPPQKEEAAQGTGTRAGEEPALPSSGSAALHEEHGGDGPAAGDRQCPGRGIADALMSSTSRSQEVDEEDSNGLHRLAELFDPSGEDQLLAGKFAAIVGRIGREGREKVAWTDHCACLPRYLATRDEVEASVRTVEAFLQALLVDGAATTTDGGAGRGHSDNSSSSVWNGRPGVVTVARSEDDGYVPADMVAFVEREVLAMVNRLYGDNQAVGGVEEGDGLEVCYEEGLQPASRD
eukprot:g1745.t2